jgi:hypothetical protein
VLFFGASWNPESLLYLQEFKRVLKRYPNKRIQIFQVFIESDRNEWKTMLKNENPVGIFVSDLKGIQSESLHLYGVRKIPKLWVLDKHGIIVGEAQSPEELNALIRQLP